MAKPLLVAEKPTQEVWKQLLENCRVKLIPRMERFKLLKFGDLACIDDNNGFYRPLYKDGPSQAGSYSLDDHGIAYFQDTNARLTEPGETRDQPAWGLSKKGEWVAITITIGVRRRKNSSGSYLEEYAVSVTINAVSLENMLGYSMTHPFRVLGIIKMEVERWEARKKVLHQEAQKLADEFRVLESIAMSYI